MGSEGGEGGLGEKWLQRGWEASKKMEKGGYTKYFSNCRVYMVLII